MLLIQWEQECSASAMKLWEDVLLKAMMMTKYGKSYNFDRSSYPAQKKLPRAIGEQRNVNRAAPLLLLWLWLRLEIFASLPCSRLGIRTGWKLRCMHLCPAHDGVSVLADISHIFVLVQHKIGYQYCRGFNMYVSWVNTRWDIGTGWDFTYIHLDPAQDWVSVLPEFLDIFILVQHKIGYPYWASF